MSWLTASARHGMLQIERKRQKWLLWAIKSLTETYDWPNPELDAAPPAGDDL